MIWVLFGFVCLQTAVIIGLTVLLYRREYATMEPPPEMVSLSSVTGLINTLGDAIRKAMGYGEVISPELEEEPGEISIHNIEQDPFMAEFGPEFHEPES